VLYRNKKDVHHLNAAIEKEDAYTNQPIRKAGAKGKYR